MALRFVGAHKRLTYGLAGICAGMLIAWGLGALFGKPFGMAAIGIAIGCGSIANAIATQAGKVDSVEEENRPITLFPKEPRDSAKR